MKAEYILGTLFIIVPVIFVMWLVNKPVLPALPPLLPPKELSDEQILGYMNVVNAWVRQFNAAPSGRRAPFQQQFDDANRYITEVMLEINARNGSKDEETLAPVLQRALELRREGLTEETAQRKALLEFENARARKATHDEFLAAIDARALALVKEGVPSDEAKERAVQDVQFARRAAAWKKGFETIPTGKEVSSDEKASIAARSLELQNEGVGRFKANSQAWHEFYVARGDREPDPPVA